MVRRQQIKPSALLDDIQCRLLPVPRRGAGEQRPDGADGLAVAADDSADIGLAHLQSEDCQATLGISESMTSSGNSTSWRMINSRNCLTRPRLSDAPGACPTLRDRLGWIEIQSGNLLRSAAIPSTAIPPARPQQAAAARALFFLSRLRTVSDGCAPRAIQCSARSSFSVLLSPFTSDRRCR